MGSFNAFGLELSLCHLYGMKLLTRLTQSKEMRTQRQIDEEQKPPSIEWARRIPPMVFVYLVVLAYMPIVPMMEVFGLVFFSGNYLVFKHQCLHVYDQNFEGGGNATWQYLFPFLMTSLYMAEAIFIVYMGLKEAPLQGGLGFIPFVLTALFHFHLDRTVVKPLKNLSLEVAAGVDIDEGELDQASITSKLYGIPALDEETEERGPMPYRRKPFAIDEEATVLVHCATPS